MKIELSKEKVKRMKAIMGSEGFKAWIEAMQRAGNEVVIMGEDSRKPLGVLREDTKKPEVS